MPAMSQKQSRYLNYKFGHQWVKEHHFDNAVSELPPAASSKPEKKVRKLRMPPKGDKP